MEAILKRYRLTPVSHSEGSVITSKRLLAIFGPDGAVVEAVNRDVAVDTFCRAHHLNSLFVDAKREA